MKENSIFQTFPVDGLFRRVEIEQAEQRDFAHKNNESKHIMRRVATEYYYLSQRHASNAKESTVTKK